MDDLTDRCPLCKDDDYFMCVGGEVFGPCSWLVCLGGCEYKGLCECYCHAGVVAKELLAA